MNMSNLPTDSFYKFCALAGTVIIIFSFYIYWTSKQNMIKQINEFNLQKAILNVETKYLIDEIKDMKELNDYLNEQKKPSKHIELELKRSLKESSEKGKELEIKTAELTSMRDSTLRLTKEYDFFNLNCGIALILGFVLSVYGYLNWYFRIQIYQDQILKSAANGKEQDYKE
jgi:hypothetical protein